MVVAVIGVTVIGVAVIGVVIGVAVKRIKLFYWKD